LIGETAATLALDAPVTTPMKRSPLKNPDGPADPSASDGLAVDRDAVERVLRGDLAAFEILVSRHGPALFHHLYGLTRSHTLAEDLSQEAFVRAYRFLRQYDPRRPFRAWLLRIGTNLTINHWRHTRSRGEPMRDAASLDELPADRLALGHAPAHPMAGLTRDELALAIERAVERLPESMRAVFRLRYANDMACDEIGATLGLSVSAVKVTLYRARERLRSHLARVWHQHRQGDHS